MGPNTRTPVTSAQMLESPQIRRIPPHQTNLKAKTCVLEAVRALRGRQEAAQVEEGMAHT